ncbi:MAG: 5-deoxy-glucuronate isomerase [Chloroflexota bacterium]
MNSTHIFDILNDRGHVGVVGEDNADLHYLAVEMLRLAAGQSWSGATADEEAGLVVLNGICAVEVAGPHAVRWPSVGGRASVFAGPPAAAYVPRQTTFKVAGVTEVEVAVFKAKTDADAEPFLVEPKDVALLSSGTANWRRDVRLVFPPGGQRSTRLIIGETLNPPGNWSGFPPHKHDTESASEFPLEEVYLFKAQPADSYGVQLSYGGKEGDTAHLVGNNQVAVFRSGYHPTVAAPGVQLHYTWALAGSEKAYRVAIDPRYTWLTAAEAVLRESAKHYT